MASIIILKVILLKLPLEDIAASLHDANEARLQLRALHTIYCTALWYNSTLQSGREADSRSHSTLVLHRSFLQMSITSTSLLS